MTTLKYLRPLLLAALAIFLTACSTTREKHGRIVHDHGVNIVEVYGDWHQMGAQYGHFAKEYMTDVLNFIDRKLDGNEEQTARAHEIAEKLYANNPEYLKDFFAGMVETSGISLDRLKLCNASEYIEGCFFCSAMAVWGDYSEDGLIFGRNYDAESYADIDKDVLVTVFHPDDGLISATVGYAGEIYCVNGLNENGIFIELNNGMPSAGWDIHWDMCPATTELFGLLFNAQSLDDVDDFFHEVRSSASFIIGVADSREARVYEWCHDGVKRVPAQNGLMMSTNHYVHPDWEFAVPTDADSWNSLARRANIAARAEEYRKHPQPAVEALPQQDDSHRTQQQNVRTGINVGTMKSIMSTPIEEGGPYHSQTRYQLVVEPGSMALHLKLSCHENWVALPMSHFLRARQ